jgi:hypothetical protein
MPKHMYTFLLLTFLMGMLAGVYIYFVTRTPAANQTISSETNRGYEIVANTYGGCERAGCNSLRIQDDGSYTYLVSRMDTMYSRYEDSLSKRQIADLEERMSETSFETIEESMFEGECPTAYDAVAYRFVIRYEGTTHNLDSCVVSLDNEPLFEEVRQYFDTISAMYDS